LQSFDLVLEHFRSLYQF